MHRTLIEHTDHFVGRSYSLIRAGAGYVFRLVVATLSFVLL